MSAIAEKLTREESNRLLATMPNIITPSLPERAELLVECRESVRAQTIHCAHHIWLDAHRYGPALVRNTIMATLTCEHVGFVDDDDLLDPDHVETLIAALQADNADLAFSWYRAEGAPETPRVEAFDDWAYGYMLGGRNLIPVTVMARREAVLDAGGFWPDDRYEDYALWMRMLTNGCTFTVVPRETWTYRFLGDNRTNLPR